MDPLNQEAIRRPCRIKDHNEEQVIMRCTFKECNQPQRWICVKCVKLHHDHTKYCLDIEELANSLKGNNEKYLFKQRKQLQSSILEELASQKTLFLQLFSMIEQQYLERFVKLELEENSIQALYNRIQTQNPLTLEEEDFIAYQQKQNEKEISLFQEGQNQMCLDLKTLNSKIDKITQSFENLVGVKQETVTELLECKGSHSILSTGNVRNGVKIGEWKLITNYGQTIGGGQYNPDGSKHGQWIDVEVANSSNRLLYVQHIGRYKNGVRIDKWVIKTDSGKTMQDYYQLSGGGQYDPDGSKHEQWIDVEITNSQDNLRYTYHIGNYYHGVKIDQNGIIEQ